jgi:hypothetical protein
MFRRKRDKKQTVLIAPFIIYCPDNDNFERGKHWKDEKEFNIVSIDPGRTNFAYRLESRGRNGVIKTVEMGNVDIRDNSKPGINTEFNNINNLLDKFNIFYNKVHLIIVEHQIDLNPNTPRILQHVISYFLSLLKGKEKRPLIFEIMPRVKGDQLGYDKKTAEKGLKAWALAKARELLTHRNDEKGLRLLNKKGKKDDMADTICQIEALCKLLQLPLTQAKAEVKAEEKKEEPKKKKFIIINKKEDGQ